MNFIAFEGKEKPMCHELVAMRLLLESVNKLPALVWKMMGVKDLIYDNTHCFLLWKMGAGDKIDRVKFTYNHLSDLYELEFFGHVTDSYDTYADTLDADRNLTASKQRNKVMTGIYAEDVVRIIQEQTGFFLSI